MTVAGADLKRQGKYRGRLAPTPSGLLHAGHARTFWIAAQRAKSQAGELILRIEDIDHDRCRAEFTSAIIEDLRWLGLSWSAGPDIGGLCASYLQSERNDYYRRVWQALQKGGFIYPSPHSRKDVASALTAPHEENDEPIFPPALRPAMGAGGELTKPDGVNWRFRVPDGETISFIDGRLGEVSRTAGKDFGDFIVWGKDGFPAYELAVVADDQAMEISEVVRGEDLLTSTARQLLLYRALGWIAPQFYHCELLLDEQGVRLAKRSAALSLRALREQGVSPAMLGASWKLDESGSDI